jgi:hypothetical protein
MKPVRATGDHVSMAVLKRYASGGPPIGADLLWAVEAHLESCALCRERLGDVVTPTTASLLARVHANLGVELARSRQMPNRRWGRRIAEWAPPGLWSRVTMTVLVVGAALGLDLGHITTVPSFVLLIAPIAPLLGVAAVWSAGVDPAHELVVASPRAGLYLVLRRTLAVLIVVIPALTAAGLLVGASPARWLLPCLAFTTGTLVLGELIGVHRAAAALALLWSAAVIGPSVLNATTPFLLAQSSLPYWAGLIAAAAAALLLRRNAYTGLRSERWSVR